MKRIYINTCVYTHVYEFVNLCACMRTCHKWAMLQLYYLSVPGTKLAPFPWLMWEVVFAACIVLSFPLFFWTERACVPTVNTNVLCKNLRPYMSLRICVFAHRCAFKRLYGYVWAWVSIYTHVLLMRCCLFHGFPPYIILVPRPVFYHNQKNSVSWWACPPLARL